MFYCKGRNVLLTTEDLKKIDRKYTKTASMKTEKRTFLYKTLKKKRGFCIFYRNRKCTAKYIPLLCRSHPLYFKINFDDGSIVWLLGSRKGRKFINATKKQLLKFLRNEDPNIISIYLLKVKKMRLKVFEEEILPDDIVKKLEEIKKFL